MQIIFHIYHNSIWKGSVGYCMYTLKYDTNCELILTDIFQTHPPCPTVKMCLMQTSILSTFLLCRAFSDPGTPNMGTRLRQAQRGSLFAQKQQQGHLTKPFAVGGKGYQLTCKKNQDCRKYLKCKNIFGGSTCR